MCGIFGCSRITEVTTRMLPFMAWEMEHRGKDSWGFSNGVEILKRLGPISMSWSDESSNWAEWTGPAIFHTRAASTGDVNIENQHPFVIEHNDRRIIGIHNGIVSNHQHLNQKHKRNYDCDSPHIFCALAGISSPGEIVGYGNLAWFEFDENHPDGVLSFLRFNSDNLNIARLKTGEIVFASTKEPIIRACHFAGGTLDKFYEIDGDQKYHVAPDKEHPELDTLYKGEKCIFGLRHESFTGDTMNDLMAWGTRGRYHNRGGHRNTVWSESNSNSSHTPRAITNINTVGEKDRQAGICLRAGCTNKVQHNRRKQVLCVPCMTKLLDEIDFDKEQFGVTGATL